MPLQLATQEDAAVVFAMAQRAAQDAQVVEVMAEAGVTRDEAEAYFRTVAC